MEPILVDGQWRGATATGSFQASRPATGKLLSHEFPISGWADVDQALDAAVRAFHVMQSLPGARIAGFLDAMAQQLEAVQSGLVESAHAETALPTAPRLADVELPRTVGQLRLAAKAARDESWRHAVIDSKAGIRSCYAGLGPVAVFGPNNFPFAFGSVSGGDFAAAIAAGNPVIGKANSSHPRTTQLFAQAAHDALRQVDLPPATVQLVYRLHHDDGRRLVADSRLGATAYTGSRQAGLALKEAADQAGKPIYLELSSINPVVILPGALRERSDDIVNEFVTSGLMGTGQFCTNPGLTILFAGSDSERFLAAVAQRYRDAPAGTLLSSGVAESLADTVRQLVAAGAEVLAGAHSAEREGFCYANTLLRVSGAQFLESPVALQAEAFGNASIVVVVDDVTQAGQVVTQLEGNLTGCLYSDKAGSEEDDYQQLAGLLRQRVGRLLNDKMPTGVAVSPAMNHGGPYPATGHPGFTAVGIPASLHRFAMLQCYDGVRPHRLPYYLQDPCPVPEMWRCVDGVWQQG